MQIPQDTDEENTKESGSGSGYIEFNPRDLISEGMPLKGNPYKEGESVFMETITSKSNPHEFS